MRNLENDMKSIRDQMSPDEIAAYDCMAACFWILFPTDCPESDGPPQAALMLIDEFKRAGLTFTRMQGSYASPGILTPDEVKKYEEVARGEAS